MDTEKQMKRLGIAWRQFRHTTRPLEPLHLATGLSAGMTEVLEEVPEELADSVLRNLVEELEARRARIS